MRRNFSYSVRPLRYRPRNRHSMPGVSCDRCGTPYPVGELSEQDGLLVGSCCRFRHGRDELDAIEASDPESRFDGETVFNGVAR